MKDYSITFLATEITEYSVSVEANSPEEALKLFNDNQGGYDWEEDSFQGSDGIEDVECVGEWIPGKDNSSSLNRFDKPIKLEG